MTLSGKWLELVQMELFITQAYYMKLFVTTSNHMDQFSNFPIL
jgi:hypothetical protein